MPSDATCFVLMPFTVREADLVKYRDRNHWNEVYEGLITSAAQKAELKCQRDDKDPGSRLIAEAILRKIEQTEVILCDLSSHNPNVFLELGWALRADKPYVLIKDDLTEYNFDLNQQYTFTYSHLLQPLALRRDVDQLSDILRHTRTDTERRYSLVRRIGVTMSAVEAASRGDPQSALLLEIRQRLTELQRRLPGAQSPLPTFPWPTLLRNATSVLSAVVKTIRAMPTAANNDGFATKMNALAAQLGVLHQANIQFSVLSETRWIYHDWEELIGGPLGGPLPFEEIHQEECGAVAWVDHDSNLRGAVDAYATRLNIAVFSSVPSPSGWKVVVETHS
jgi:hypothetical protein